MTKYLTFKTKQDWLNARLEDVTSTEVSCLFNSNPYCTHWELWQQKRHKELNAIPENDRMKWGLRLEQVIADGVAEDNGLIISDLGEYARHGTQRGMGASFDYSIDGITGEAPDEIKKLYQKHGPGILEIKNVDGLIYRRSWLVDDDYIEAPEHIEIQVQQQMEISDREWCIIAPFVGGNDPKIIIRLRDRKIGEALRKAIEKFWVSIDNLDEPTPNFETDSEFIIKRFNSVNGERIEDMTGNHRLENLMLEYKAHSTLAAQENKMKDACKAEIITIIGDAKRVGTLVGSVTSSIVAEKEVCYTRKEFRTVRINIKKELES